ncbi:MAG: 5'/3'-nucleotidase SurE, partial [Acidimicrobiia bacterium]
MAMNDRPPPRRKPDTEPGPAQVVVDRHRVRPSEEPHILLTNDDGVESPGLRLLAHALAEDFEVTVAAPSEDQSG